MDDRNGDWDVYFATGVKSGIEEDEKQLVVINDMYLLAKPNVFKDRIEIVFNTGEKSEFMELRIFDTTGRLSRQLFHGCPESGVQIIEWDGRDDNGEKVSAGCYFIKLKAKEKELKEKVIFLK